MRNVFLITIRFMGLWVFNALCLELCDFLFPGLTIVLDPDLPFMITAMSVALFFTFMNLLIRPLILLLTIPLNSLTFGFFSLIINGLILFLVSKMTSLLRINTVLDAFWAGFLFAAINIVVTSLFPIDEDLMYYDIIGDRARRHIPQADLSKKGIVVIEIDGLAHPRLMRALEKRKMPYLKELIESGNYVVSEYDCGIPSQTSSSQAGIMFGQNQNICAFRWYDKTQKRVITSSSFSDTNMMEQRIMAEQDTGLLEGGMSINNMMSGNAAISMFTVSSMRPKSSAEQAQRNLDLYLFSLRPYLLTKSIIFTLSDTMIEMVQYFWAWLKQKNPRLNRLRRFYPLIRGICNVLLRDISTALTINEIHRDGPATYTTFYGYDEIAHHSGPDSFEAYQALTGIDRAIKKIHHAAERISGRTYELFVLSDHGQSFGKTFRQRYAMSLSDYIRHVATTSSQHTARTEVIGIENTADNDSSVRAAIASLLISDPDKKSILPNAALSRIDTILADKGAQEKDDLAMDEKDIWVMDSGNLANVYFTFTEKKLTLEEIESVYPNLCSRLIDHPGIGVIIVRSHDMPLAIGKSGIRNLNTGELSGEDPLRPYGNPEIRAQQLSYLSSFPNGGDIIVFSTVYPDGTVAAFEELIGSHGGMGGEQNSAFIFHEILTPVPDGITNSAGIYSVLRSRREIEITPPVEELFTAKGTLKTNEWGFKKLAAGISDTQKWTTLLRDALLFQIKAYRKISLDASLNGAALLLFILSLLPNLIVTLHAEFSLKGVMFGLLLWSLKWMVTSGAAYLTSLAIRSKATFIQLLRVLMISNVYDILLLSSLISGHLYFWLLLVIINRSIACALAVIGTCQTEKQTTRLMILPIFIFSSMLIIFVIYLIFTSIVFILDVQPLIQFIRNPNI